MSKRWGIVLLIIAAILGGLLLLGLGWSIRRSAAPPLRSGQQWQGKLICLPHKSGGITTEECAYGLQTTDGTYYGLTAAPAAIQAIRIGERATITGTLSTPDPRSPYAIAGVLAVQSLQSNP